MVFLIMLISAPEYKVSVSGGHRAQEAVQLLKEFYNGENPYAPNPKVKGVKIKKDSQRNGNERPSSRTS